MNIVITGGAGFVGARLARALLAQGQVRFAGGPAQTVQRITLVDQFAPPADLAAHPQVEAVVGDLVDLLRDQPQHAVPADTHLVAHLASAVSGECEANFDLGMRSNLEAGERLLAHCRRLGTRPMFLFSSTLGVFGQTAHLRLPEVIQDNTLATPQGSYGSQKFILEQLAADYARKGFVQGRTVRLMTVSVRPGRPNGAASSFLSGIIREPLAGQRAVCPVPGDTPVALASPTRTVEGILRAIETSDTDWGPLTAMNLPAITTTPTAMAAALAQVAGQGTADLIDWTTDPVLAPLVLSWPAQINAERARRLGLLPDASFEDIVRDYARENPDAVQAALT